jgi:polyferredoxin
VSEGNFYDVFLQKFSRNETIPDLFNLRWFRGVIVAVLFTTLGIQVYTAWGDVESMGYAFVRILTFTTTVGIVLGAVFQQRAWCHICPMGTLGNWLSKGKERLHVSEHCKECKLCAKVCPMQLKPYEFQAGVMENGDCIKCSSCVAACPIHALGFDQHVKRAA